MCDDDCSSEGIWLSPGERAGPGSIANTLKEQIELIFPQAKY
jgi:hypothetical protein